MSNVIKVKQNGLLYLGETLIPGIIKSLSVNGEMVIDKAKAEGASGQQKTFSGFDDSGISLSLLLTEEEDGGYQRYTNLGEINRAFKALENGVPLIYTFNGPLFSAMNIRHGLFKGLSIDDSGDSDALTVSLKFEEHDPLVSIIQEQQKTVQEESEAVTVELPPVELTDKEIRDFQRLEAFHAE